MQKRANANHFQQGDVLITKIDALPAGLKKKTAAPRGYVIAEGEVTGHAHTIATDAVEAMFTDNAGAIYAQLKTQVDLLHEEHHPVTLPPGLYRFGGVQEYDHFKEEARQVVD